MSELIGGAESGSWDPRNLDRATIEAIKKHAVACWPQEMCGVITAAGWEPLQNRHLKPREHFDCSADAGPMLARGELLALIHSHPDDPPDSNASEAPSGDDVAGQLLMGVPWGLVLCNKDEAEDPFFWGDCLEPPPLEGRIFRHGPSGTDGKGDCGALVRDYFRLERGIRIPDFAREDDWWLIPGCDLYEKHFAEAGFKAIPLEEVAAGDVVLFQVRSPPNNPVANHAGVYVGDGLILHHLSGRLSRVEGAVGWLKFVRRVLRYVG